MSNFKLPNPGVTFWDPRYSTKTISVGTLITLDQTPVCDKNNHWIRQRRSGAAIVLANEVVTLTQDSDVKDFNRLVLWDLTCGDTVRVFWRDGVTIVQEL